jgi:hypothetical protein
MITIGYHEKEKRKKEKGVGHLKKQNTRGLWYLIGDVPNTLYTKSDLSNTSTD